MVSSKVAGAVSCMMKWQVLLCIEIVLVVMGPTIQLCFSTQLLGPVQELKLKMKTLKRQQMKQVGKLRKI